MVPLRSPVWRGSGAPPIAITRPLPSSLGRCQLTHLDRVAIDVGLAAVQHALYEQQLRELGYTVCQAPAADDLPDSVFVEDVAVVLPEVAIVTRPGAALRRSEPPPVAALLAGHRPLVSIAAPATLDGGDVLRLGRSIYVGLSTRTTLGGARALARIVEPLGYTVTSVPMPACLHLKSAATALSGNQAGEPRRILCNPEWIDPRVFARAEALLVDPLEPSAGNVLRAGASLLCAAAYPRTNERLAARGYDVRTVDVSELAKAEGAITCCSVLVDA